GAGAGAPRSRGPGPRSRSPRSSTPTSSAGAPTRRRRAATGAARRACWSRAWTTSRRRTPDMDAITLTAVGAAAGVEVLRRGYRRLQLSMAKHRSLRGHARIARFVSKLVPFYEYGDDEFFRSDGAPPEVE